VAQRQGSGYPSKK